MSLFNPLSTDNDVLIARNEPTTLLRHEPSCISSTGVNTHNDNDVKIVHKGFVSGSEETADCEGKKSNWKL